jgi:hypothetical protein
MALEIRTGTEHWRAGEITLAVDGSGAASVVHRRAGQETRYDATLDESEVSGLARRLQDLDVGGTRSDIRDHKPDEMSVTLALRRHGEIVHEADRPESERHDDERFAALMGDYDRLVERLTDGALPYGQAAAPG